ELHRLPTYPPNGVRYYSGAWGRAYELNQESAADAITAAVLDTIDFPRVVNAAYADGARIFIEVGPGSSCTRMIGSTLAGRPQVARASCLPRQDTVSLVLRLLANLHAEGVPLDLSVLYDDPEPAAPPSGPTITLPVGYHPKPVRRMTSDARPPVRGTGIQSVLDDAVESEPTPVFVNASNERVDRLSDSPVAFVSPVTLMADTQAATAQAHASYLRFATAVQGHFAQTVAWQTKALQGIVS